MTEVAKHTSAVAAVRQFGAIPTWLATALDSREVVAALNRNVPEFANGALTLRACVIDKLHMRGTKGQWERTWIIVADGPEGEMRVPVRVNFTAPGLPTPEPPAEMLPFGTEGWSCWLPELRMLMRRWPSKKRKDLPALAALTDPEQARSILEAALRSQAPGYADVTIRSCKPEMLVNKPGDSAVIRYRLDYGPAGAGRGWRDTMILKAYDEDIGRNAFAGMRAVWQTPLRDSEVVRIPEPLAHLPAQFATLLGPVPEEQNLEKRMLGLLLSDDPAVLEWLYRAFTKAGVALAAFHSSGASAEQHVDWEQGFAEAQGQMTSLRVPFPNEIAAFDEVVGRVRALVASSPADALVPSHGAFRPEQVLVSGDTLSFIDFDMYCLSEPANDLALFRATMMDSGLYDDALPRMDDAEYALRLERLDALNESFLAGYAAHAPVSRQRVALWEAIHYINDALQRWTKPHPDDPRLGIPILERHLRGLGVL